MVFPEYLPPYGPPGGRRSVDLSLSDFVTLRRRGHYYVDRTLFILRVLTCNHSAMLIPRPRRFGKTTNMTMLRDFFALPGTYAPQEDVFRAFEHTAIAEQPLAMAHFQQYPVLYFTFKDCKALTLAEAKQQVNSKITLGLMPHAGLKNSEALSMEQRAGILRALAPDATLEDRQDVLLLFTQALKAHHKKDVVLLIDEYDAPILHGLGHGFYEQMIAFFKGFFGAGFKDNGALFRGVLTGILRVSQENMFSDLNNIGVYSFLNEHFKTDFGFTDEDVVQLCADYGCPELVEGLRKTYNGYQFGMDEPVAIYNPYSTVSCVADPYHALKPYWHSTGNPSMINRLVLQNGVALHTEVKELLEGKTLKMTITEHIELQALSSSKHLFSLMVFSGYLKVTQVERQGLEYRVRLTVVNQELKDILDRMYLGWLELSLRTDDVEPLTRAVLGGEAQGFEHLLRTILLNSASVLDGAGSKGENFYQGLLLGLTVALRENYQVSSNLEVGYGRADLLLVPKEPRRPGVVMELKVVREGETLLGRLLEALTQLEEKSYTAPLLALPAEPVIAYGVAFDGKVVRVARLEQKPELLIEQREAQRAAKKAAQSSARAQRQRARAARAPQVPVQELTLHDRLALEALVVPLLDDVVLKRLWVNSGHDLSDFPQEERVLQWAQLVLRCERAGKLNILFVLLLHLVPTLETAPLLQRLVQTFQGDGRSV